MIDLPVYETKLPVKNKTVEFSPLVVKEEKNIAIAKESGSKSDSYITFLKILREKFNLDPLKLTETDLIHCIIELRKKSISEQVQIKFNCPYSQQDVITSFNCNDIILRGSSHSKKIKLSDYIIEIAVPQSKNIVVSSIQTIETPKQKIEFSNLLEEKKEEIVDSLPINIKNELEEACNDLYHYSYDLTYTSDRQHKIEIRSAEDFFTLFFAM
tara:strand:+ start:7967 stop:8605 length:639 start_codon:yes stop_codon:yes gene_type:complete